MKQRAKPPAQSEDQLARAVAQYLDLALPYYTVWSTIGHGGGGKVRGAQLKARGVKPGFPDLVICWLGSFLAIELKTGRGQLSDEQKLMFDRIERAGGSVFVCRSVKDVALELEGCGMTLRARP